MALAIQEGGQSKRSIIMMMLGRWKSLAFLVYIRPQVLKWAGDMDAVLGTGWPKPPKKLSSLCSHCSASDYGKWLWFASGGGAAPAVQCWTGLLAKRKIHTS